MAAAAVNEFIISTSMQSHAFAKQVQSAVEKNSSATVTFDPALPVHFLAHPSTAAIYISPSVANETPDEALIANLAALLDHDSGFVVWHADASSRNASLFEALQCKLLALDWRNVHLVRCSSAHDAGTFITKLVQFGSMRRVADDKFVRANFVADAATVDRALRPPLTDAEQAELVSVVSEIPRFGDVSARAVLAKVDSLRQLAQLDQRQVLALNAVSPQQAAELCKFFSAAVTDEPTAKR